MTVEEKTCYDDLRVAVDESIAYFMKDTGKTPGEITALELLEWLHAKTLKEVSDVAGL